MGPTYTTELSVVSVVFAKSDKPIRERSEQGLGGRPVLFHLECKLRGFPGGTVVKNLPANAGDTGSIPGQGRSHMLQSN